MSDHQRDELIAVEEALKSGKITQAEYDYFLQKEYGIDPGVNEEVEPTRIWPTVIVTTTLLILLSIGAMFLDGGITGFIVGEFETTTPVAIEFSNSGTYGLENFASNLLKVSGTVSGGTVSISAQIENETLLIYESNSVSGVWLDKESYALNETLAITVEPADEYSYWLTDDAGNKTPIGESYITSVPGTYLLEAISNTSKYGTTFTVRNDTNKSNDILAARPSVSFVEECVETCNLNLLNNASNITLVIILSENATFFFESITTSVLRENSAPEQIAELPDLILNDSTSINLSSYFTDPDGDEVLFEINNLVGIVEVIEDGVLYLESITPGAYEATIYASDLSAITQATMDIIVIDNTVTNTAQENETNETNTTGEIVRYNTTAKKPNVQLGCDHPNINKRPPECFGDQFNAAFQEVVAPLKDKQLNRVGRFTRLGNLVIKGTLVEQSNETPETNSFSVGTVTQKEFLDEYTATAWISANGDLHLRGQLYEEVAGIEAPSFNSYVVANSNGLILGYFDETTGDLYLRGNIVQLGSP